MSLDKVTCSEPTCPEHPDARITPSVLIKTVFNKNDSHFCWDGIGHWLTPKPLEPAFKAAEESGAGQYLDEPSRFRSLFSDLELDILEEALDSLDLRGTSDRRAEALVKLLEEVRNA